MAISLLWTLATGDASIALPLGIFFELFWLDQFPIGSFQPPNGTFPLLVVLTLARFFNWTTAEQLVVPSLFCLCFAYITPAMESWLRPRRAKFHNLVLRNARKVESLDKTLRSALWICTLQFIGLDFLFFIITTALTGVIFHYIHIHVGFLTVEYTGWPFLLVIGALGAFLALRVKHSYIAFCTTGLAAMISMALILGV